MTWRAHIEKDPVGGYHRLYLSNVLENRIETLLSDGSHYSAVDVEPGALIDFPIPPGIALPGDPDAIRAIADALLPHHESVAAAKAELKRLEEALQVERRRVDQVIDDLLTQR